MIFDFLRKLTGGKATESAPEEQSIEYEGFDVLPAPQKDAAGWRIHGVISKSRDGEREEHVFTRADTCSARADAVAMTISKAKRIIDEQGDGLFKK